MGRRCYSSKDLALFNSTEFESVIRSMKGKATVPGLDLIRLKQTCDFFQYILETSRTMKNQYLTHNLIKGHAVQFKTLQNSKEVGGLTKLTTQIDVLSWMDRSEKHLQKIPGVDNYPLAYFICEDAAIPVAINNMLPGKCYSSTYKSIVEKIVHRKSHSSSCVESDKVTFFDFLEKALQCGPLKLALQPHEDSKDGQAVIKSMYVHHGGRSK